MFTESLQRVFFGQVKAGSLGLVTDKKTETEDDSRKNMAIARPRCKKEFNNIDKDNI